MRKTDLYEITVKILGLYLVFALINQLKDLLLLVSMFGMADSLNEDNQTTLLSMFLTGFIILLVFTGLLLFKTKGIVKFISRPIDYEEQLSIHVSQKAIYEIALVLLGLIAIVWSLPEFILQLKQQITHVQHDNGYQNPDSTFLIINGIRIIIGGFVLIWAKPLAIFFTDKLRK